MMKVEVNTSITYQNILDSKGRITHHIGGTRSGKTYAILQYLIVEGLTGKKDISIVRKTIPSLKRTVLKDWKDLLSSLGIWDEDSWNASERIYKLKSGSRVSFINTDDPEKLRGLKSDILFIDEASEIDEESYFQLSIRTSGKIILAYNPTISPYHWLRKMEGCERYNTTYKDNPYLPAEMIKAIEDLQYKNKKYWTIYGLGEYAPNEKAIYQFEVVDNVGEVELVGLGLDWGFAQDELALVAVYKNGDDVYLEELIYEKGLVMNELIGRLQRLNVGRTEIWCDSSEPRSIEELNRAGFVAKPVKKGPDSIKFGISVMQNYNIKVYKQSQNLINEIYSYQWATDKYGEVINRPEDGMDHLLDAARYVAMMRLSIKNNSVGKYAISVR